MASPDRPGRGIRRQPLPEVRRFRRIVCTWFLAGTFDRSQAQRRSTTLFSTSPHKKKTGISLLAVLRLRAHAADSVRACRVRRDDAGQRNRSGWRRRSSRRSRCSCGDDDDRRSEQSYCCRRSSGSVYHRLPASPRDARGDRRRHCAFAHGRRFRCGLLRSARQVRWSLF